MRYRVMWGSSMMLLMLGLGAASPAQAQFTWTFGAGAVIPAGTFDDYFEHGATVGAEAAYPLQDAVDITFGADWDHYNMHSYYGTPNLNQFRFQVGILADLLGRRNEDFTVEGRVSVGASSIGSEANFWLETSTLGVVRSRDEVSFSKKGLTGGAGLRLRFGGGSRLNGFLGVSGNVTPLGTSSTQVLRDTEPTKLGALSSAVSYSITAGFSMSP
jgi:hypothetical protein